MPEASQTVFPQPDHKSPFHAVSSEEINFLVYRYLQESGYAHSAFTFAYESLIARSNLASTFGREVPPGALVSFIQRGLLYLEIEASLAEPQTKGKTASRESAALMSGVWMALSNAQSVAPSKFAKRKDDSNPTSIDKRRRQDAGGRKAMRAPRDGPTTDGSGSFASEAELGDRSMEQEFLGVGVSVIPPEDVVVLNGHQAEVFCCAWHPSMDILASGSGDSTVRLWDIPPDLAAREMVASAPAALVLDYMQPCNVRRKGEEERDVTTLEWSKTGTLLATGCMDGVARLWSNAGTLQQTLAGHTESIFSLRFDSSAQQLLTGSYDKTVAVWDVATGNMGYKFEAHSAQVLDVDWKPGGHDGHAVFASCSTDKTIAICVLDKPDEALEVPPPDLRATNNSAAPTKLRSATIILEGHLDEVNAIRWDPSGTLLASCSDDHTAKLWRMGKSTPIHELDHHSKEIYTIRWSPTGPNTSNPNAPQHLASASFDSTVRLWDPNIGCCTHTLKKHDKKVYTVCFSPSGQYLASGSLGGQLHIWSVQSGHLLKSFRSGGQGSGGSADIFEVAWNASGTRLAATSTNAVTIIDLRMDKIDI